MRNRKRESAEEILRLRARVEELERALSVSGTGDDREMLGAVLDTSVAAVCILDTDGRIRYANRAAERILGLEPSEIVGRAYNDPNWKTTDVDGGPWPEEAWPFTVVMRTGRPVSDVRHTIEWPNGRRRVVSINGAPIRDAAGAIARLVFSVTDITESFEAERRVRRSEANLRALFETFPGFIVSVDRDHRIRYINRILPHLSLEDVIGIRAETFITEEFRDAYATALDRVFANGSIEELETRTPLPDDEPAWFLIRMGPVMRDDEVESATIVGIDITELKQVQQQLQQAQRLDSIGRLAGGVAHDFNNLLTAVDGYADLLQAGLADRPDLLRSAEQIRHAAAQGASLTRQLLTFARKQVVAPQVVDVNRLIERAVDLLRRLIGEDLGLELDLVESLPAVRLDPAQFEQVLVNLVVNARDATPAGGTVTLRSRLEAGESGAGWVVVSVVDTGVGMSDDVRQRVFEPFFTTKPAGKGTGLGLATSLGIVEQSGGRLEASSAPGAGSTFRVVLPATDERAAAAAPADPASEVGDPGRRILLVEDEPMVRQVVARGLEQAGYRVVAAGDGPEALRLAAQAPAGEPFDALVTDVVMPKMSGIDVADRLRRDRPDLRVVFMSGYASDVMPPGVPLPDGTAFIQKPFTPARLAATIAALLRPPSGPSA